MRWVKTWMKTRPPGRTQPETRRSISFQLFRCSNISMETTRSKESGSSSRSLTSAVITRTRSATPRRSASASIQPRCGAELETAVMRQPGEVLGGVERERAPAAAEIEDVLAVLDAGPLADLREARLLRLLERRVRAGEEAAAVLAAGAEEEPEELRRQRVVLLVRGVGGDRDRALALARDELGQAVLGGLDAARPLAAQDLADPVAGAGAEREVGDYAGAEQAIEQRVFEAGLCHRMGLRRQGWFWISRRRGFRASPVGRRRRSRGRTGPAAGPRS